MDARQFYQHVIDNEDLEWRGVVKGETQENDGVFIGCLSTGHRFFLTINAIKDHDWSLLSDVLFGKRQAHVMTHMTRIVGYFSQIQNWNASKVAELNDRRKGRYNFPEVAETKKDKKNMARSAGLEPAVSRFATLCPIH